MNVFDLENVFIHQEVQKLAGAVGDNWKVLDSPVVARLKHQAVVVDGNYVEVTALEVSRSYLLARRVIFVAGVSLSDCRVKKGNNVEVLFITRAPRKSAADS